MRWVLLILVVVFSSCSQTFYIVRHAEKVDAGMNMSSDVPLSDKGKERAFALKKILETKRIAYIFSTNTLRARSTAQPVADYFELKIETYGPVPDSAFINLLKSKKGNKLVVGHSNTVGNIVNMLCDEKKIASDLKDSEYDNLFIVRKKGKRYFFSHRYYGERTP